MKNEKGNFKNSIKKAMKTPARGEKDSSEYKDIPPNKPYDNTSKQDNYIEEQAKGKSHKKDIRKMLERPLIIFGSICIAASIVAFILTGTSTVDTSESAKNALRNKVSNSISAGTILLSKDENVEPRDYTISHKSDDRETRIWVWDYAAEDGDYVQVLVNGSPLSDAFMIKHKPRQIVVPASGDVQIKGIRDGGGGITYAVRYEINGTSYFNGASEGQFNTYTLRKE